MGTGGRSYERGDVIMARIVRPRDGLEPTWISFPGSVRRRRGFVPHHAPPAARALARACARTHTGRRMSTASRSEPEPSAKAELVPFVDGDFHVLAPALARDPQYNDRRLELRRNALDIRWRCAAHVDSAELDAPSHSAGKPGSIHEEERGDQQRCASDHENRDALESARRFASRERFRFWFGRGGVVVVGDGAPRGREGCDREGGENLGHARRGNKTRATRRGSN